MRMLFMLAFTVGLVVCFVYLQEQEKFAPEPLRQQTEQEVMATFQESGDDRSTVPADSSS